jgi:hypothetical protein
MAATRSVELTGFRFPNPFLLSSAPTTDSASNHGDSATIPGGT